MDEAMLGLWQQMEELPVDLRLHGGTAIALYLGHRPSTDFDVATPPPEVSPSIAPFIPLPRVHRQS